MVEKGKEGKAENKGGVGANEIKGRGRGGLPLLDFLGNPLLSLFKREERGQGTRRDGRGGRQTMGGSKCSKEKGERKRKEQGAGSVATLTGHFLDLCCAHGASSRQGEGQG